MSEEICFFVSPQAHLKQRTCIAAFKSAAQKLSLAHWQLKNKNDDIQFNPGEVILIVPRNSPLRELHKDAGG
jgi:hypothetical protein